MKLALILSIVAISIMNPLCGQPKAITLPDQNTIRTRLTAAGYGTLAKSNLPNQLASQSPLPLSPKSLVSTIAMHTSKDPQLKGKEYLVAQAITSEAKAELRQPTN